MPSQSLAIPVPLGIATGSAGGKRLPQPGLHQQREHLGVPLRELILVVDPGDQAAVDADIGELAELVGDLLGGADQRIAAVAGDEMRLVRVERLGIVASDCSPKMRSRFPAASQSPFSCT